METSKLEINNNINLEKNNNIENATYEKQKNFLDTNLGQAINLGIDFGIKAVLPNFLEDEVIEIKDSIITDGFKEGIKTAIDNAVDLGKSFLGIFTGKFENISQIKEAIKFYVSRLATLGLEMLIMFIFVTALGLNTRMWVIVWTIFAQVVIVIGNYVLSKLIVFRKK